MLNIRPDRSELIRQQRWTAAISAILLAASLTQTAFTIDKADGAWLAILAFLTGWMDLFGAGISWLANPLVVLSWIFLLCRKSKFALLAAFFSVLFALSFLCFRKIMSDEGGNFSKIVTYNAGYWLWLSSCIVSFAGSLILFLKQQKTID